MIALGSQNGSIYLFRVSRDGFSYKKVNKIRGSQPLQHLDWSVDGSYMQTVTIDFDLLFCKLDVISHIWWKLNLYYLFNKRGCQIIVTRTQPYCHERCQMVNAQLHRGLPSGRYVEQSLLYQFSGYCINVQSIIRPGNVGFGWYGRLFEIVQVRFDSEVWLNHLKYVRWLLYKKK